MGKEMWPLGIGEDFERRTVLVEVGRVKPIEETDLVKIGWAFSLSNFISLLLDRLMLFDFTLVAGREFEWFRFL